MSIQTSFLQHPRIRWRRISHCSILIAILIILHCNWRTHRTIIPLKTFLQTSQSREASRAHFCIMGVSQTVASNFTHWGIVMTKAMLDLQQHGAEETALDKEGGAKRRWWVDIAEYLPWTLSCTANLPAMTYIPWMKQSGMGVSTFQSLFRPSFMPWEIWLESTLCSDHAPCCLIRNSWRSGHASGCASVSQNPKYFFLADLNPFLCWRAYHEHCFVT